MFVSRVHFVVSFSNDAICYAFLLFIHMKAREKGAIVNLFGVFSSV